MLHVHVNNVLKIVGKSRYMLHPVSAFASGWSVQNVDVDLDSALPCSRYRTNFMFTRDILVTMLLMSTIFTLPLALGWEQVAKDMFIFNFIVDCTSPLCMIYL